MKRKLLACSTLFYFITCHTCFAQISKACIAVGGSGNDICNMLRQTADSGFVECGTTFSFGLTSVRIYIVKVDKNGNLQWTKTIGGLNGENALDINQTKDGGYIFGGFTTSFGAGFDDFFVGRLDANGNLLWTKAIGGLDNEFAFSAQQTADGGYAFGGYSRSFSTGDMDFMIVKLDSSGNFQWSKTIGSPAEDQCYSMEQTSDHGYVMAGETVQSGNNDVYVVKLDSVGNLQWTKVIGGSDVDRGLCIRQTIDQDYIVSGTTRSFGQGAEDDYVIKLDPLGNILWTKTIGGVNSDYASSIWQATDEGYVLACLGSFSIQGSDIYVVKLDAAGNFQWGNSYGGINDEFAYSIQQTFDGGYAIGGITASFGSGFDDFFIEKIEADGSSCCFQTTGGITSSGGTETSGGVIKDITPTITSVTPVDSSNQGTLTAMCITISGVNDITTSNDFSIYPNPNDGYFQLKLPDNFGEVTLSISDMVERKVYEQRITNTQSEKSIHLPGNVCNGVYLLRVDNGSTQLKSKLIVSR